LPEEDGLKALETVTVETGPKPSYTVIWMHGLGADGHDFEPLVPELLDEGMPAIASCSRMPRCVP
jgi:predicted esterase